MKGLEIMNAQMSRALAVALMLITLLGGLAAVGVNAGAATKCHTVAAHTVKRHWVKAHISHSSKGKIEHVRGHWVKTYVIKAHKVCVTT